MFSYLKVLISWQVKLGEEGWKKRYYAEKFGVETESYFEETRKQLVRKFNIVRYYFNTYVDRGD